MNSKQKKEIVYNMFDEKFKLYRMTTLERMKFFDDLAEVCWSITSDLNDSYISEELNKAWKDFGK